MYGRLVLAARLSYRALLLISQICTIFQHHTLKSTRICYLKIKICALLIFRFCSIVKKSDFSYTQNGILHMLDRNKRIKAKPEKFQDCHDLFEVIICCEERVYDQVIDGTI